MEVSHAPDDAVGADSYQAMQAMPKLSIETKPRLMVADMAKLTPTRSKEQRARTSKGEHHAAAETTNRWDWCVAALSLGYICVHKDLVLGAIRGAMAQPTLGWGFAVAFHVAFGVCCTLLIGWGVHKGPGSGWFKRWRDEYLFAYTMLFTTNVFFVATQWPIDQRFVNREVYQPTWDPVFSSMVMLFFHLPPRYLLLQGLEAAVVHSYVAIGMHGLYQGDLSGALMHVLINTGVCAVAPVVMSAAWLNESKHSRHHRSAPRNTFQRWLQEVEASLMRAEARLMRFVAGVDRAVLATLCCGPIVGMVIVKNFKAISTPLADPPKVCASSPFEVLAAIMCTAVLILAEVGIKAMTLLKQLRHKEEVVRDIFPQHVVDRMAAHQALNSPASSTSSSRSTRDSDGGTACRLTGYVTSSSHGSSSDGWATPSSGTSGNGRPGRPMSTVTSLTASLSGGIASLSGGFGNYFSRASETDARATDARMTVSVPAPTSGAGSANGSAGDHGDSPVTPVTPLLRQVGQKLGMHKAGSSATSTPKHNSRKSIGSLAQRHAAVTILFADICGFTQMSDVMDPLAVMDMLHSLYSAYDSLSEVLPGVYKIETIGDCYMAASGLIQEHADHAEHMLQFALYMQELASQHSRPDGSPLTIRVGMHSGAITSGLIGSVRKRYCLFGDTVNTASRMETTCTPGGIQISAAMHALVGHISNIQWREKQVEVKGKGLMTVYEWLPSRPTQEEEIEEEEVQHLQEEEQQEQLHLQDEQQQQQLHLQDEQQQEQLHLQDEQQQEQQLHEQQLLEGEEEVQHQHVHQQLQEVQQQVHDGDEHASLQQQQQEIRQWIDQQEEGQPEKEN